MSFLSRPPAATICGLTLTHHLAHSLVALCDSLSSLVRRQIVDVTNLPSTPLTLVPFLKKVQSRQQTIKQKLLVLISHTQQSAIPWLREFEDLRSAMDGKIKTCNKKAKRANMGWLGAARTFWPMVGESCEILLGLLERLRQELQNGVDNEELWRKRNAWIPSMDITSLPKQQEPKTTFDKVVRAQAMKDKGYEEFTTRLISHRKHTAGKYKKRETSLPSRYTSSQRSSQRHEEGEYQMGDSYRLADRHPANRYFLFS